MEKVLVTGGAGYIGSVLVRLLLEKGYNVRVFDNLSFGGESIVDLLNHDRFEFLKGDMRNEDDLKKAVDGIDYIAHLAAIVGDPACRKFPEDAKAINLEGSKSLYSIANEAGVKKFVFASTCSNYGKMDDPEAYVNEDSKLAPVSLYAETKVAVEKYLLNQPKTNNCKPTSLRFSTVYGLSPRPRFDLTVNEFTRELALGRELVIFGEQFWRPYCHVVDLSRSVIEVFEADDEAVAYDVFNVGDTDENYQKEMIVNEILKVIPDGNIKYVQKDEDPRDYRVSFDKIKDRLGFKITKRVPDGIKNIKQAVVDGFFHDPDDSRFSNI
ncbi:NAD-dependent epimerase/dehydratase family protein [Rhodohalobacter barkolensis]|uniref:Epimerase n=1 Tax=Rhodohalobacter barkolensis TaxID=2053187 RepID=A0A2N0VGG0_9BACT|nr:NAD(P)-dependent oxidoreductase [Rhodohalobacter barkolensis]PKD43228.1 epimerase [Rhodohalobacter barkolensis]